MVKIEISETAGRAAIAIMAERGRAEDQCGAGSVPGPGTTARAPRRFDPSDEIRPAQGVVALVGESLLSGSQ
jgi:hypothetical protein